MGAQLIFTLAGKLMITACGPGRRVGRGGGGACNVPRVLLWTPQRGRTTQCRVHRTFLGISGFRQATLHLFVGWLTMPVLVVHNSKLHGPAGSDDGRIFVWDYRTAALTVMLGTGSEEEGVWCVRPHPGDPMLASSGMESCVRLWTPEVRGDHRVSARILWSTFIIVVSLSIGAS